MSTAEIQAIGKRIYEEVGSVLRHYAGVHFGDEDVVRDAVVHRVRGLGIEDALEVSVEIDSSGVTQVTVEGASFTRVSIST